LEYIGIFNFSHGSLAEARPKLRFGLSIFGVLLLFGSHLSGLKSMLVHCHRDCHEFGRCLTFAHLIFDLLEVCLGQKIHRFETTPNGTVTTRSMSEYQMKSCPNWQAKSL